MAKNNRAAASTVVLLCLILVWASVPASECLERPAPVPAWEEDVRSIKCGACKKVAEQLYHQAQDKQAQISAQEITKEEVVQITKKTCNLEEEADSTHRIDTVEQGDKSKLADQYAEGICDAKCKTMQEACNEVMEGADLVSDFLNEPDPYLNGIVHYVCKNVTTPCNSEHSPSAEGTLEAFRLGGADEDNDEDGDGDEDTDLAPKQGEVLGEVERRKGDGKLAKGIQTAKEAVKRGAAEFKKWLGGFGNRKPGSEEDSNIDKSEF